MCKCENVKMKKQEKNDKQIHAPGTPLGDGGVEVRTAGPNDAAVIADLSRITFYDAFAPFNTKENMDMFMEKQFTREKLMKEVGAPGNVFLLATIDNEPAGYVRVRESVSPATLGAVPAIELARIYATQQVIGKGVGSALMKQVIELSKQMNKQVLWLGVWEHNKNAIEFYIKWGFEKFGEHDFVLGTDVQTDWLMKKML